MIRFLVDAQLPPPLCEWFQEQGAAAEHVTEHLRGQTPDAEIARYAADHSLVLVTKDDDFALRFPPIDYRLIWLRCGNISNRALREWLAQRWPELHNRLLAGEALIEVR